VDNTLIKDIPKSERPRERLKKYGRENISNEELLSIILNTGTKNKSVKDISNLILSKINDITDLKDITLNSLKQIDGIGEVKAIKILASIELGKRVYMDKNLVNIKMDTPEKIYNYMKNEVEGKNQEYFYAIYLDSKKNLIDKKLLFIGTLNKSIVHPREIFKYAYLLSASSIICVHNHPSGDTIPSKEDLNLTKALVEIGKIQGINIIDHIIIGKNYYSLYQNGDL
jgi:DNA repair protein RadC